MEKMLRYAVLSGIYAVPFIPLVVASHLFFPFITGKNFTFRIVVELMLAAWALLLIQSPTYRPKASYLVWSFLAFLLTLGISTLLSENVFKSFWSNFERMEGYITLLHLFAYLLIFTVFLRTEKDWNWWLKTSTFVAAWLCGFGAFQLAGVLTINQGGVRLDGTLGNATYLAVYMLFHIFFLVLLYFRERSSAWTLVEKLGVWFLSLAGVFMLLVSDFGSASLLSRDGGFLTNVYLLLPILSAGVAPFFPKKYFIYALLTFEIFILYHTATRGAILGLIGGALLTTVLIAIFDRKEPKLRKISGAVILGILAFVGVFFAVKEADFVQKSEVLNRFANISISETTTQSRFQIWNMALQGFKERPFFGWGQENFNYVFNKYYDSSMFRQEQWFDRTHNVVLDWLIAGGVFGLLTYLTLFFSAVYLLWKKSGLSFTERALITGLLSAYFFHNLFVFDNLISYLFFFAVLAYIHTRSLPPEEPRPPHSSMLPMKFALPAVGLLLLAVLYVVNIRPILAGSALISSMEPQKEGAAANLAYFKRALSYDTIGTQEAREQLIQAAASIRTSNLSFDVKNSFFELAVSEMGKMIEEAPNDTRHPFFLGGLYNSNGLYEQAIPNLKKALETSPGKQAIKFELGVSYIGLKRYDEALAIFKEAYESAPGYDDARLIYAVGAVYAGKMDLVQELLVPRYGNITPSDDRLVRAYRDTGRTDLVLQVFKNRADASPTDPQTLMSLAAAYFDAGRKADSIATLKKIGELRPDLKPQTDKFIEDIQAGRTP